MKTDIFSYPSDITLKELYSQWKNRNIIFPELVRGYTWKRKQASLLIDSFMKGFPVPPVFLYDGSKSLVIDGEQRLLSIFFFFDGYFRQKKDIFKLVELDDSVSYAGRTYKDLLEDDRRKLNRCVLRSINIRSNNCKTVFQVFERLNNVHLGMLNKVILNNILWDIHGLEMER